MSRSIRFGAVAALLLLALVAFVGSGTAMATDEDTSTTETTSAPDTSDPGGGSSEEEASETDDETPWWVLIIVGVAVIILIAIVAGSGKKKETVVVTEVPSTTWKTRARAGYADAHWLYDNMTEDLAVWRGNATADATTGAAPGAGSAKSDAWAQLGPRLNRGTDALYAAKAEAPDPQTQALVQAVVTDLNSVRSDVDGRAEARRQARQVESADATAQAAVRDDERRASQRLAEDRNRLAVSLTNLASDMS